MAVTRVLVACRGDIALRIIRTLRRLHMGAVAVATASDSSHHGQAADSCIAGACVGHGAWVGGARRGWWLAWGARCAWPLAWIFVSAPPAPQWRRTRTAPHSLLRRAARAAMRFTRASVFSRSPRSSARSARLRVWCSLEPPRVCGTSVRRFWGCVGREQCRCPGPADNLRVFSDKLESRDFARGADVLVLPSIGGLHDAPDAPGALQAAGVAYPVVVKHGATRVVCRDEASVVVAVDAAVRGGADAGVYIEQHVATGHDVEIQLCGDGAGAIIALGERECWQRCGQKIVVESPCQGITSETRAAMVAAAVRLGAAVDFRGAATVLFLYEEGTTNFYFRQVVPRVQVEHNITELVTGVDLVEWMVRLAAGDSAFRAGAFGHYVHGPRGHALEVRLRVRALQQSARASLVAECGRRQQRARCAGSHFDGPARDGSGHAAAGPPRVRAVPDGEVGGHRDVARRGGGRRPRVQHAAGEDDGARHGPVRVAPAHAQRAGRHHD